MITLNLLKQKKAYLCAGLLLSSLFVNAQDPLATDNTEITGVTVEFAFDEETAKSNFKENITDNDPTTVWAGNLGNTTGEASVVFNLGAAYNLAEIQYLTVTKEYLFQIWVSTTATTDYASAVFTKILPTDDTYLASNIDASYKSFDLGSISGATFVKILCNGRSDSDWNTISELKFYEEGSTASTRDNILSKTALYPNPANDFIYLSNADSKISKIEVVNLEGKTLLTKDFQTSEKELSLNTSALTNGVYFVKMSNQDSNISASKTIIVQH